MTAIRYFAYGSNMLAAWLQSRCKSARATGIASLAGYRLTFNKRSKDGSGKAMLAASDNQAMPVYGVLYDIDDDEIVALDRSEGRGKGYERVEDCEVRADGDLIRVMTYMADKTAVDASVKPYDWYLDLTVKGAEQQGLPGDYVKAMSAYPCLPDPVPDRKTRVRAYSVLAPINQDGIALRSRANIRIAGDRRIGEWVAMRAKLTEANDPDVWKKAHSSFFMERITTRYFDPISILRNPESHNKGGKKPWLGEGFAIVGLQCSLIEFLGAALKGQTYILKSELKRLGRKKTVEEYIESGEMFVEFLQSAHPFKSIFGNKDDAWDFYKSVRCGLLHEARTRNNWRISSKKSPGPCVDVKNKIVYRNDLQDAFLIFAKWYGSELIKNRDYQNAFIRKFDSLCKD